MGRKMARRWRAALLGAAYIVALSGLQAGVLPASAAAQTPSGQIANCTTEGTSSDLGTVSYAVYAGGTWTFACGGTGPFTIPITTPLTVASGRSVTLLGGGQAVTLDGGNDTQIAAVSGALTIDGLTLADGLATVGGAVYDDGGTLAISNSTFSGNQAVLTAGAIVNDGGRVTIDNSTFSGNQALTAGGAIVNNAGEMTISDTTFSQNEAGETGAVGNGGEMSLSGSTFSQNDAVLGAGAVSNSGTLTVTGSTFSQEGGSLGAVDNTGTMTVAGSTFSQNVGATDGGIDNGGEMTLSGTDFNDNQATAVTGAIDNTGEMTLSDSTFSGNITALGGGAVSNSGQMTISHTTINGNQATSSGAGAIDNLSGSLVLSSSSLSSNYAAYGVGAIANVAQITVTDSTFSQDVAQTGEGAAVNSGQMGITDSTFSQDDAPLGSVSNTGTLTVAGSTFSNNAAETGGVIVNSGEMTVSDSTFSNNQVAAGAGAIGSTSGNITISGSTFSGNDSGSGPGAILSGGTMTLSNTTFTGNEGGPAGGGAITNSGDSTIGNSTFGTNTAGGDGGAIVNAGALTVTDSAFGNDSASADAGGAIASTGPLTVANSTFTEDRARYGGAISGSGSTDVADATFSENVAAGQEQAGIPSPGGGALAITGSGTLTATGSTFSANTSAGDGGAIEDTAAAELAVSNSTFSQNSSTGNGGAIATSSGTALTLTNSTLSGNGSGSGSLVALGGNLYGGGTLNNTIVASPRSGGNCSGGEYAGTNDLEYGDATNTCAGTVTDWVYGNPDLQALAPAGGPTETLALSPTSPAIGQGAAPFCAEFPFDQRGYPRPASDCDIGAYESTPPSGSQLPAYTFASPTLAPYGSLTAADTVAATVYAVTYDGQTKVPYAPVYLSLSGTGTAVADGVPLTAAPQLFVTDANGQVQVSFTAGPPLLGGGTDVLTATGVLGAGIAPATATYAYPAPAVGLAFATPPLSGSASSVASLGPLQVELEQAGGGSAMAPPGGVAVTLSSDDATGGFSSTLGGNLNSTLTVTIPAGATVSGTVYFGDPTAGTPAVVASAHGAGAVSQQETVTAGAAGLVTLTSQRDSLPVGGTTTVSGLVYDSHGNPVPNPSVTLTATAGSLSTVSPVYGGYSATFQAPSTPGAVTVTASVYGGATAQTLLLVTPQGVTAQAIDIGDGSASTMDLTATGAGGTGDVEVADYSGNPGGPPTFESSGVYFDVALLAGSSFSSLTLQRCGVSGSQALYWWNGTAWAAVSSNPAPSYDAATGCLSVTLDTGSSPSLADLTATPFALSAPAAGGGGGGGGGGINSLAPAVLAISPASGPAAGGTEVTITGNGFTGATAVAFGGTAAAGFSVDSDTEITATSPAGTGTVDVTVTTPYGISPTAAADRFAYTPAAGQVLPPSTAPTFSDVPASYWAYGAIEALAARGIVVGFPDGTFRPGGEVTRAQFAKMLDLTLGLKPGSGATSFTDVPASAWFAPYVTAAVQAGIVDGISPTRFDPNGALTREQMAVLLARALKLTKAATLHFTDDTAIDAWAVQGVEEAVAAGYIDGFPNGTFQPRGTATRAQAADVLAMVLRNAVSRPG